MEVIKESDDAIVLVESEVVEVVRFGRRKERQVIV